MLKQVGEPRHALLNFGQDSSFCSTSKIGRFDSTNPGSEARFRSSSRYFPVREEHGFSGPTPSKTKYNPGGFHEGGQG